MSQGQSTSEKDIQAILDQWRRERPDLDAMPMAVCGSLWRAGEVLKKGVLVNIAKRDLDFLAFDVLMTLRRQGKGQALSPSALAKEMMLSTSAMTNRLDRLEKRGLIERISDKQDRRGLKIVLTDAGFQMIDDLVESHVATEDQLLSSLSEKERAQLMMLLNKI